MNVLLVDSNMDSSSQEKILKEGHTLYLNFQLEGTKNFPLTQKDGCGLCERLGIPKERLVICNGYELLEKAFQECSVVMYNCSDGGNLRVIRTLYKLSKKYNKVIINNQLKKHIILEEDRMFAKTLNLGFDRYEIHKVTSFDEYLKIKSKKRFVIKAVDENSKYLNSDFRTVIPQSKESEYNILKEDRYNHFKAGGVVLEEYIEGVELCMGFYWDGSKIVGNTVFINQEYKGIWEKDLGGILCGECGSAFYPIKKDKLPKKASNIIKNLEAYLVDNYNDYHGFIDINFMLKGDKMYLLEFTVRPGFPTEPCLTYIIKDYTEFMRCVSTGDKFKGKIRKGATIAVSFFGYGIPLISSYVKKPITIVGDVNNDNVLLTSCIYKENNLVTYNLDRPVIAIANSKDNVKAAIRKVYEVASKINIQGFVYRYDIGSRFVEALNKIL